MARRLLGPDGPIASALGPRFEARAEQLQMAEAVADAMERRGNLLVEAGTGVGKSFAYLVPAVHRAITRHEVVVIATHTIALQEQLLEKDIPLIEGTLPEREDESASPVATELGWLGRVRAVLVKGRGNYLSIRRLKLASERQEKLLSDAAARRSLHVIEDWAYSTEDGTLSTLPPLERPGVWDKVQSDSGNCMGRKCPTYEQCFYQSARRDMEGADLLICNHAVFFADLALRAQGVGFLPRYDHVVLDEAHNIEDVASEHFGLSLTEGRVMHLLTTLYQRRTGKGYLANVTLAANDLRPVELAVAAVIDAERAARAFFESVIELDRSGRLRSGRITTPRIIENELTPVMNTLVLRLRALREQLPEGREADRYELNAYTARAAEIADAAEKLIEHTAGEPGKFCYWAEVTRSPGEGAGHTRVALAASPIEVGPLLREHLFGPREGEGAHSVILTSATLATRTVDEGESTELSETAFAHFMERTGSEGAKTLQLGSPFRYADLVELYADRSMPEPAAGASSTRVGSLPASPARQDDVYARELVSRILDHVIATDGGAFVLFTSFGLLKQTADLIGEPLAELGFPLHVQSRDGSRAAILERFRADPRSVLFGAATFWQGVDVPGDALRNVIITRLPFDPPDRPLTEARTELIRARGGSPFAEDALPRAIIRFKQGFGRLVRTGSDRGRVVVLDPRLLTKPYGRLFLRALPPGVPIRELR